MNSHLDNDPLSGLAPMSVGSVGIYCPSACASDVLSTVIAEACTEGRNFGPSWPVAKVVTVLISGTVRQVEYAKALHACTELGPTAAAVEFRHAGSQKNFDFLSPEGRFFLESRLERDVGPDRVLVFMQMIDQELSISQANAFADARSLAKLKTGRVVAILAYEGEADENQVSELEDLCDEFFSVEECEPDPDQQVAFSVECHGLRGLRRFGLGKVMCKVEFGMNGRVSRTFSPFLASGLVDRAVRMLRGSGKTMAEIGEIVGLNKSNISRRLDGWQPVRTALPDGWVEALKVHLDCAFGSDGEPQTAKSRSKEEGSAEDDKNDFDDDDDDDDDDHDGDGDGDGLPTKLKRPPRR